MASIIKVEHLSYVYNKGMPGEVTALEDVSFEVEEGDFVGIIGATGSGKSTLIGHMNGLNRPTSGKIIIDGRDVWEDPSTSCLRRPATRTSPSAPKTWAWTKRKWTAGSGRPPNS